MILFDNLRFKQNNHISEVMKEQPPSQALFLVDKLHSLRNEDGGLYHNPGKCHIHYCFGQFCAKGTKLNHR